jgi:hypothetical protein
MKAIVPTGPDASPEELAIHRSAGNGWRLLSDQCALELEPVCDSLARPVTAIPDFDQMEVFPVHWGLPDSLIADHPEEVEAMKRKHYEGAHALRDGCLLWELWLQQCGKWDLWFRHRTPALESVWLNERVGPGFRLVLLATGDRYVSKDDLNAIRFRAEFFYEGKNCSTAYLSRCAKQPLHVDEVRLLPSCTQTKLAAQKELSRGWTNAEYSIARIYGGDGAFDDVAIPAALRRIVKVLDEEPGRTLDGSTLYERVVKLMGGSAQDYRVSKILNSKCARRLLDVGIIEAAGDPKARIYRLRPPTS